MVNMTINRKQIHVNDGITILEAAKTNNIIIPTLCHSEAGHDPGACRICVVEVEGMKNLMASCITKVKEGMVVYTNSEKARKAVRIIYELLLSDHPKNCLNCIRNQNCEFQKLGEIIQIENSRFDGQKSKDFIDESSPAITRNSSKCVSCRRCVTVCNEIQGVGVLGLTHRGFNAVIAPAAELPLNSVNCSNCGQCTVVCPVDALKEHDSTETVWKALYDKSKRMVVQTAPAIRAALGEEFGYEPGTLVTGKMVSALREIGFVDIFDTNFAADLTIIEEGHELLGRLEAAFGPAGKTKPVLPMITSCSPGWIKFMEHEFPEYLGHLSSCKSPHMMLGALAKTYYAAKAGVNPRDMYVVSVMPCTAKKFEITRPEMRSSGYQDVDAVLTTRELARMIKESGINFNSLSEGVFNNPLGFSTGAADIFGVSGGVMEAALRTVYEVVTGRELPFENLRVTPIEGVERIKEAEIKIENPVKKFDYLDGITVKIAVTSGLAGARILLNQIKDGTSPYQFIEIMGCPGGCITGGGQPRPIGSPESVREKRLNAIFREDNGKPMRKSHENPFVQALYKEFLIEPLGHKSHELLHTSYTKRGKYNELIKVYKDR
ncbi:MAG: NADH-dependent [FeFe] hydrogenase, group A6 [Brevinematales bacterium]|jgi:NADH-quinone oxidoreductase subunit G/NADP-reducing hydrogenase subunit HndD